MEINEKDYPIYYGKYKMFETTNQKKKPCFLVVNSWATVQLLSKELDLGQLQRIRFRCRESQDLEKIRWWHHTQSPELGETPLSRIDVMHFCLSTTPQGCTAKWWGDLIIKIKVANKRWCMDDTWSNQMFQSKCHCDYSRSICRAVAKPPDLSQVFCWTPVPLPVPLPKGHLDPLVI
jgi:hypothetical protein